MKPRKLSIGDRSKTGQNIARLRTGRGIAQKDLIPRLQTMGVDINPTSYSKPEGQLRISTDREIFMTAKLPDVDINELFR